jgi:hypothetical protein
MDDSDAPATKADLAAGEASLNESFDLLLLWKEKRLNSRPQLKHGLSFCPIRRIVLR